MSLNHYSGDHGIGKKILFSWKRPIPDIQLPSLVNEEYYEFAEGYVGSAPKQIIRIQMNTNGQS